MVNPLNKIPKTVNTFVLIFIVLAGLAIFLINSYQVKTMAEVSSIFKPESEKTLNLSASPSPAAQKSSEAEQIAQLRQEIEELKKQQAEEAKKSALRLASPPPVDIKTQEELNRAQEQIKSLTQQLVQIQKEKAQSPTPIPVLSDADLLKSWQASDKVVQVACLDKFLNSWQMGSGVLVSADGKVLTNQHVVQSSLSLTAPDYCLILFSKDYNSQTQSYSKQYRAILVGSFQDRDAALLKINDLLYADSSGQVQSTPISDNFSYFQTAPAAPQIGDSVYVIGFPESANFAFSVTKGIISNLTSDNLYFGTDAQIDRGNSGGAALNRNGQLIGLPTYKFVSAGDYRGYILNIQTIKLN